MKSFFLVLIPLVLAGCASIESVSLTSIPKERSRPISASASRMIFLGFNFDNNYVNEVPRRLIDKCEGGTITGILTKDESIWYFPPFVYERRVAAQGYCVK